MRLLITGNSESGLKLITAIAKNNFINVVNNKKNCDKIILCRRDPRDYLDTEINKNFPQNLHESKDPMEVFKKIIKRDYLNWVNKADYIFDYEDYFKYPYFIIEELARKIKIELNPVKTFLKYRCYGIKNPLIGNYKTTLSKKEQTKIKNIIKDYSKIYGQDLFRYYR